MQMTKRILTYIVYHNPGRYVIMKKVDSTKKYTPASTEMWAIEEVVRLIEMQGGLSLQTKGKVVS